MTNFMSSSQGGLAPAGPRAAPCGAARDQFSEAFSRSSERIVVGSQVCSSCVRFALIGVRQSIRWKLKNYGALSMENEPTCFARARSSLGFYRAAFATRHSLLRVSIKDQAEIQTDSFRIITTVYSAVVRSLFPRHCEASSNISALLRPRFRFPSLFALVYFHSRSLTFASFRRRLIPAFRLIGICVLSTRPRCQLRKPNPAFHLCCVCMTGSAHEANRIALL